MSKPSHNFNANFDQAWIEYVKVPSHLLYDPKTSKAEVREEAALHRLIKAHQAYVKNCQGLKMPQGD